jgi:hypothetical protein
MRAQYRIMCLRSRVRACMHAIGPLIAAAKRVRASTHPTDFPIITIKYYRDHLIRHLYTGLYFKNDWQNS